jgi:hypothetical protein
MADQDTPTRSSNMEKAEGDRDDAPETEYDERGGAGITNRPIDEELENQKEVPPRGKSKPGAHAG